MPLFLKPHTATRYVAEEYVSESLSVGGVLYGDAAQVRGQLYPLTASVAIERTGADRSRPHEWLWDDGTMFSVGDLVKVGDRWFRVSDPPQIFDAEPVTAHARVVLEEIEPGPVTETNPDL